MIRIHHSVRCMRAISALSVAFCMANSSALAENRHWANPEGGVFDSAKNWLEGIVPGGKDTATFGFGGSYLVAFPTPTATMAMEVIGDDVTFLIGSSYTLTTGAVQNQFSGRVGGEGTLRIDSGQFRANTFHAGSEGLGHGSLIISGSGTTFESPMLIGGVPGASGNVTVREGALLSATSIYQNHWWDGWVALGYWPTSLGGDLLITGEGSRLECGRLSLGNAAFGQGSNATDHVRVEDGGAVECTGELVIGDHEGDRKAFVEVDGSNSSCSFTGAIIMNASRESGLTISNGGTVTTSESLRVGVNPSSTSSTVLLMGDNTSLDIGHGLSIAENSDGSIVLQDGAGLVCDWIDIGLGGNIAAAGSSIAVGDHLFMPAATGSIQLSDIAILSVAGPATFGGNLTINDSSAQIEGRLDIGLSSHIAIDNGALSINPLGVGTIDCLDCLRVEISGEVTGSGLIEVSDITNYGTIHAIGSGRALEMRSNSGTFDNYWNIIVDENTELQVRDGNLRNYHNLSVEATGAVFVSGGEFFSSDSTGSISVEIAGPTSYSTIDILDAPATVSGALSVSLVNGYNPERGDSFDIIRATALHGEFIALNVPPVSFPLVMREQRVGGVLSIKVVHRADVNLDGIVDYADLLQVRATIGSNSSLENWPILRNYDVNGDGSITWSDYGIVRSSFDIP